MVKHIETIRRLLPTNCFSGLSHFVGLALKGFSYIFQKQRLRKMWYRGFKDCEDNFTRKISIKITLFDNKESILLEDHFGSEELTAINF